MARKSRRVNGNKSAMGIGSTKTPETCAGVYLRLSSKDSADKDSIHNQKAIIEGFLEVKPDIKVFKYYIDDGVSSYKDIRPAFEEMMQDIKCGLINTVIVKDISRFGRNYIETGTYLETIFPRIGIRFISVSEAIDSQEKSHKEFEIAIKSLLNHFYAQDISIKVKSVVKQKQISGEYIAARLPYGYEKNIIDGQINYVLSLEKAEVVKKIFKSFLAQ
jgi:site-specific DNA recombinase